MNQELLRKQGKDGSRVSEKKRRWNTLIPVMVVLTVLILLCCIIIQIRMYVIYLDLRKVVTENSQILSYHKQNDPSHFRGSLSDQNTTSNSQISVPKENLNKTGNGELVKSSGKSISKRNTLNALWMRYLPEHLRVKRSGHPVSQDDDGRGSRRNRQNNRGNRHRGQESRTEETIKVKTVLHLQLTGRDDKPIGQGEQIKSWVLSSDAFNTDQDFAEYSSSHGQVKITKAGVYLIYSQITFLDNSGRWSYSITLQEQYRRERPFIKCLSTEWGIEAGPGGEVATTFSQCYTAAVTFIKQGETVRIKSLYATNGIHTDHDMSFWGFVKLS